MDHCLRNINSYPQVSLQFPRPRSKKADYVGLFMGFLVGIILLLILYVAVSGVAGMQVTYAAFDKESGASAQKKSQ